MNPAFLENMSWEMAEVYGAVNDQILINLAKYFPWFDKNNLPASSFAYQAKMLAQMGKINRETISIIKRNLTGANGALGDMLEQAIIDAIESTEPELVEAVKKGIFSPAGMPIVAPNQMRAYQLYYQQAAQKLNLVNTVMLESTQSAYQQAVSGIVAEIDLADRMARTQQYLDIAAGETITGVSSWNTALRHAMDRLTTGGITGFVDHAGRQWSAEAYVAMDIRTTVFNTGRAAVWETNQNFGNDLYIVSYHNGARPLCYPWQNKVISSTNNARTVTDLDGNEIQVIAQSETSYGQAAGLFGINCKHHPDPFIPGVSVIHGEPQNKEENDRVYAESQEQRALERKIREQKRDLMIMKEQGATPEEIKAQRAKIRQTDDDIDEFCEKTGRARRQNREGVYTKREFPDANKYDVAAFESKQKDLINQYYQNGGEQQGYTFGQMTPKQPIIPITSVNVASQVTNQAPQSSTMNYGKPFEYTGNRKAQQKQFADAKAMLDNAPDAAKKAWSKAAGSLDSPLVGTDSHDAYYSRHEKRVHFRTYKIGFEESSYQRKGTVFFHEYGHNLDNFFGGYTTSSNDYLSIKYQNGIFGKMIEQESEEAIKQWYAQSGMKEAITDRKVGKAFAQWVKNTYTIYERGDISDMFERYMCKAYKVDFPFGVGHGYVYAMNSGATEKEAFAEMFSAMVTGNDSLPLIKKFFPKSYKIFEDMLGSVV